MTSQEKLLWAAFERIKARPELYDQTTFGGEQPCGTVGCLAYHICDVAESALGVAIPREASRLMGFDPGSQQFIDLFGVPDSYCACRSPDSKIAWLENHIRQWVEKYYKGSEL